MKLSNLLVLGSMAVMGAAFTSCSKDIAYDSEGIAKEAAQKAKAEYEVNFVKKYGQVDPNQSWDFSSMQPTYSLSSENSSSRAITRSASYSTSIATGFKVEQSVLEWMFVNIPAGRNNFLKGDPFYMTIVSGDPFTIVPIFQGNATNYWQLWMHVDGIDNDILIWAKGENVAYRTEEGGTLIPVGRDQAGVDRSAFEVEAPAITFTDLPVNSDVEFYLKKWSTPGAFDNDGQKTQYTKLSSLNEKMLVLQNCKKPAAVPDDAKKVCIIGCEDAGDKDYEDLVFMVYGDFSINEPQVVYQTFTKRYMVEDLGSRDDFDFNDIVVDVKEQTKTTYNYTIKNGKKTLISTEGPVVDKQWAEVRAAGGIIDFTINVGPTTSWTKSEHLTPSDKMWNTGWNGENINYSAVLDRFDIKKKDWIPSANNISITVDGRGTNSGVQLIPFPKEGDIPMIIAVDKDVNWMVERQSIPGSWIQ